MTNEEAIKQLVTWVYYMSPNFAPSMRVVEELRLAVDALNANFKSKQDGQPLTLEQLRGMDGKCVKVVVDGVEPLEMLALVEIPKDEDCILLRNNLGGVSEFYSDDDLREDGVKVYAYPPARIDREAWEPCGRCAEKDCSNCAYGDDPEGRSHCKNCEGESWWRSEWTPYYDFCPWCGRPMTEHAWAELEKRVRGSGL